MTDPRAMTDLFDILDDTGAGRCVLWTDRDAGMRAVLVIDDMTLGPAAGGVRTWRYPTLEHAVRDAASLARAMTLKCSLAGLDAGGAKLVLLDHDGLDREGAFARLGQLVQELGGLFRTAGDLGTSADDLEVMARGCQYVHATADALVASVARGVLRCIEACAEIKGVAGVPGLRVAVQGCGAIGEAVATALAGAGADVRVADLDASWAIAVATEIGVSAVDAQTLLAEDVDVLCPCAVGGVITAAAVGELKAWAVCGAANNMVAGRSAEQGMVDRGILYVPDIVSSAGAVIDGIGETVMGLPDRSGLIDALGDTARELLRDSQRTRALPSELAEARAWARIRERRAALGAS